MPYYRVRISGTGVLFPSEDGAAPIVGFFTARDVYADQATDAQDAAIAQVLSDWLPDGRHAPENRGALPTLSVDDIFPIGWFRGIFGREPSGYIFHTDE